MCGGSSGSNSTSGRGRQHAIIDKGSYAFPKPMQQWDICEDKLKEITLIQKNVNILS